MDKKTLIRPDYIFEVSWEVCNKVGGIHTVISTKALTMVNEWGDDVIMIGPDIWNGPGEHPEFAEDKELLASWRNYAASQGLRIKIGRWKIVSNPIVVLIDFTPFYIKKDEILANLWTRYKVDSLTGQWDYIEPALFGYAAGKVIETFYHHHLTFSDKIVAQFHEWMMGAGVLYVQENIPQVGSLFTTHATVIGRCLAGNGRPFYSKFDTYNADQEARSFNVIAKHSLEKTAANVADCFTTVSHITARECERFLAKAPDIITPNGFEEFIVPDEIFYKEKRALARRKLLQVAKGLTGQDLPDDSLMVIKSGRYEFRNKGIDVFIDALGLLNKEKSLKRNVLACIFIPAHQTGARKELLDRMNNPEGTYNVQEVVTHYLQGSDNDPIINAIYKNELDNREDNKVKVIFAPVYLDGNDGIFNLNYYDLLTAFDLSAFPSYYEPWGYTPLESIAFQIPTITTNLAGFSSAFEAQSVNIDKGIAIVNRTDTNGAEASQNISGIIAGYCRKNAKDIKAARDGAGTLSQLALWKNYIQYYKQAYSIALAKTETRAHLFHHKASIEALAQVQVAGFASSSDPVWRKIFIQSQFPESLVPLQELSKNLWWGWNKEAHRLFESIDKDMWKHCNRNPVAFLSDLSYEQIKKLEEDHEFITRLDDLHAKFREYVDGALTGTPQVAYFCMEYGLDANLKMYSGGLGILAGDYLKEASDQGKNMVAVGLLYRQGYMDQKITIKGEQSVEHGPHAFTRLPLLPVYDKNGNWRMISLGFPGRTLYAKVWKIEVGRIPLYLLDTDVAENKSEDRIITEQLYGGDWENRLKQELLLGVGGVRMLRLLGYKPDVYHYNEGHAAFAGLELLSMLMQDANISFDAALEIVRASSLFTTHTPVPAGHDAFSEDMLRAYLAQHANLFNISWKRLMGLGRVNENDPNEKFSMSFLAARLSQEINGVSELHGKVSRRIFSPLWTGYSAEELHIGYVTNEVHYPTWTAPDWQRFYAKHLGEFKMNTPDKEAWAKIHDVYQTSIWDVHQELKKDLLRVVNERVQHDESMPFQNRKIILEKLSGLDEKALIIGYARRFVRYKRSYLLFKNREKLISIIRNAGCPVLFLFAGKAHPADQEGKDMVKRLIEISKDPDFAGNVIFLNDYDIELAKRLVRGVDVWLNTPELELEASGTSGMKAVMNGVLNFSMLDGWWAEGYREDAGWAIGGRTKLDNHEIQDEMDADSLYRTLEQSVIPTYTDSNVEGVPLKWVTKMENSIAYIAPQFTMKRMLEEYESKFYQRLYQRCAILSKDNYKAALELAAWKIKVAAEWNEIEIVSADIYDSANKAFPLGGNLNPKIVLYLDDITVSDIGVELLFIKRRKNAGDFGKIISHHELLPTSAENKQVTFSAEIPMNQTGVYEYAIRVFPKNILLPHRQDFALFKWF